MRKRIIQIMMLIVLLNTSCSSYKNTLAIYGGQDEAIKNAIVDFTNTSRLYKKDSVFSVQFIDTLYRKELKRIDERSFQWINGLPYDGIIAVRISTMSNKRPYIISDTIEIKKMRHVPSRYLKIDNKLFYWKDDRTLLNKETLKTLKNFDVVGKFEENSIVVIDESKKATHYYMCRKDFSNYKKIETNIAIGYYDAPKNICD